MIDRLCHIRDHCFLDQDLVQEINIIAVSVFLDLHCDDFPVSSSEAVANDSRNANLQII